jgi:hypothetical protein
MLQCQPTFFHAPTVLLRLFYVLLRDIYITLHLYGYISTRSMPSIYNPCAVFVLLWHVTMPAYHFHAPSVLLRLCSSTWCQCYSTSGSPTPTCGLIFYIYSFPTQALMVEMCAWQPFTHQTEIYNPSTTSTWTLWSDWVCSLRLSLHILRTFSMQWMNTLLPTNIFSGLHSFTFLLPTSHFRTFCEHFRDYSNRTVSVVTIHVTILPYFLIYNTQWTPTSAHLANIIFLLLYLDICSWTRFCKHFGAH